MAEEQTSNYLREYFPDKLLGDLIVGPYASLDDLLQVSTLTVLHDNIQLEVLFVDDSLKVADDAWVLQLFKDVYLSHNLLLLFFIHLAIVELLPN